MYSADNRPVKEFLRSSATLERGAGDGEGPRAYWLERAEREMKELA